MGSVRVGAAACTSWPFENGGLVLCTFSHPDADDGKVSKVISGFADSTRNPLRPEHPSAS